MLCGWLSPDGLFFQCSQYGHVALAKRLVEMNKINSGSLVDDEVLLDNQYMKIFVDGIAMAGIPVLRKKGIRQAITNEQIEWLKNHELSSGQERDLSMLLELDADIR